MNQSSRKPINRFIVASVAVHAIVAGSILVSRQIPDEKIANTVELEMPVVNPSETEAAPAPSPVVQQTSAAPAAEDVAPTKPVPAPVTAPKPTPVLAKQIPTALPEKKIESAPAKPAAASAPVVEETPVAEESNVEVAAAAAAEEEAKKKAQLEEEQAKAEAIAAAKLEEQKKKELEEQQAKEAQAAAAAAAAAQAAQVAEQAPVETEGQDSQNAGPGPEASEVRQLEDLKQLPGNPRPQYSQDERLKGHKGQVTFQAFVTQDGRLSNFKMLQSSGHRNLDAKTLKALKQWKFQPGQEGWVELPFNWDLKGGPQELPALLRRKVGSGN